MKYLLMKYLFITYIIFLFKKFVFDIQNRTMRPYHEIKEKEKNSIVKIQSIFRKKLCVKNFMIEK